MIVADDVPIYRTLFRYTIHTTSPRRLNATHAAPTGWSGDARRRGGSGLSTPTLEQVLTDKQLRRGPGRPPGASSGQTRARLLDVARELLGERGFDGTTIREIARRADVNPALLHYYFGSKAGLHSAVMGRAYGRLRALIRPVGAAGPSAEQRLRQLVTDCAELLATEPCLARLLRHEIRKPEAPGPGYFATDLGEELSGHLRDLLDFGVSSGEFRAVELPGSDAPARLLFTLILAALPEGANEADPMALECARRWARSAADLILRGIGTNGAARPTTDARIAPRPPSPGPTPAAGSRALHRPLR